MEQHGIPNIVIVAAVVFIAAIIIFVGCLAIIMLLSQDRTGNYRDDDNDNDNYYPLDQDF